MSVFTVLEKLAPHIEREVNLVLKSNEEAETLSNRLKRIERRLEAAERKGATDTDTKDWLEKIEDTAYQMADVLDEWEMANLQVQLQGSVDDLSHPRQKVSSFVTPPCFCCEHWMNRREITKKIQSFSDKIDQLLREKREDTELVQNESNHPQEFHQPESTPDIPHDFKFYGRESDLENLLEKLVPKGNEDTGTQIVSIVGGSGLGKTTLVKYAYHLLDSNQFGLKGWVSVPNPLDSSTVARSILQAFKKPSSHIQGLPALVDEIKEVIKDKKFLLVLDNFCTDDSSKWEPLKCSLHGASGSRVVVTTWNELSARIVGTTQRQQLEELSGEDCEDIVLGLSLDGKLDKDIEEKRSIGAEIAKKCHGLPLAASQVGIMLSSKSTVEQWKYVRDNPLWTHEEEMGSHYRLLKLSYVDLPPMVKRCFLSCVAIPRGSFTYVDELIRIWMAYGYLNSLDNIDTLRSKGLNIFDKLATRSFFDKLESDENNGSKIQFKIQDRIYSFAVYLSRGGYNSIMDGSYDKSKRSPFQRTKDKVPPSSFEKIRTFCASYISQEELPLNHLTRVRVLRMNNCNLEGLPEDIGRLIHLRYLNLSDNPIKVLPDSICDLYYLQTLALENCSRLCKLPQGIRKLVKLKHLLNNGTEDLKQYPQGLKELTGLWTLSEFRASTTSELEILGNLNDLQGSLRIILPKLNAAAKTFEELGKANLKSKVHLRKLELCFGDEGQRDKAVKALQAPPGCQVQKYIVKQLIVPLD